MEKELLIEKLRLYGADIEGINSRFMGNWDLYKACFEQMFDDPNFEALDKLMLEKKYDEAFMPAHGIKGLSGNLGLTPLYKSFCDLVECLRNKIFVNAKQFYEQTKKEIAIVLKITE